MSIRFGPNIENEENNKNKYLLTNDNQPIINEKNSIMTLDERETFANINQTISKNDKLLNASPVFINDFLFDNCKLWLWDWDNTLIDIGAYYQHSMEPEYIKYHLTDEQLFMEFPGVLYFRSLVKYLVRRGYRVGIVTFGVYKIVKAYMDRIFGFGQHYFDQNNLIARSVDVKNINPTLPANKNSYIQRIMNFYKIPSHSQVVLFDDNATNIGDALILGVIAIQQGDYDDDGNFRSEPKKFNHLFTENFMLKVENILRSENQFNPLRSNKLFGWLGGRKASTRIRNRVNNEINRNNCEVSKIKVENYYRKELEQKQRMIDTLVEKSGCQTQLDGSIICKLKEQFVPYSVMSDLNKNNKDNNEEFKCYGCQDQSGSYLMVFMICLLLLFFAWIVWDNSR